MIRKIKALGTGCVILLVSLIVFGCKQQAKEKEPVVNAAGQTATVEVGIFNAVQLKDELVQTIRTGPKPKEMMEFLSQSGVAYMPQLTVPLGNVEKFMTSVDQTLANGMYRFDTYYAKVFNRQDVVVQTFDVFEKLATRQGQEAELAEFKLIQEKVKANVNNKDSLDAIITDAINKYGSQITQGLSGEKSGFYGLMYVGINIEGMYILTQSALMAKDNKALIDFIGKQKERVEINYMVLELLSANEAVAPVYEKMKPVLAVFQNNPQFTEKQLKEVANLIADLRKDIVK